MSNKKTFDIKRRPLDEPEEIKEIEDEIKEARGKRQRPSNVLINLLIILIAFAAAVGITALYGKVYSNSADTKSTSSNQNKTTATPTSTNNSSQVNQSNTPTATNNDPFSPLATKETPAAVTTTPDKTSKVPDKNSFKIRILNGNGITGDAAKLKKSLTDNGFQVGDIGNAKLKYDKTQIYYIANNKNQADLVKQNITGRQIEESEADSGLVGDGYQILIIIGKS